VVRHERGSPTAAVVQTSGHHFHDPSSPAELAQLHMHPHLAMLGTTLLKHGCKPQQVCTELNSAALTLGSAMPGGNSSNGGSALEHYSNARTSVTLPQVYALRKQRQRASGYGLTNDHKAVAVQMAVYTQAGHVAHWQPYMQRSKTGGKDQPLIIIIQTTFQKRMLNEFGRRLVFMDSTGSTNKYGYPLYALTVGVTGHEACSQPGYVQAVGR